MITAIRGNIVEARRLGELTITERGYIVLEDGVIRGVFPLLPDVYAGIPVADYGDCLVLQAFCDMHMHAPQYPLMGMGMDLPLLEWLNRYAFPTEAAFADPDAARRVYAQLAKAFVDNGTTRVCLFSSLHCDATLTLMAALEDAGVTGYVGKVNMDRNCIPSYQEATEESKAETLRWLDACGRFSGIKPILTPRFTPACSDDLMAWLGALAKERGLYVQSHLSENVAEIAWVKRLHPDCRQYWETYDKFGLLDDHTIMAHCVYSDEREQAAMRDRNVLVAHSPDSNIAICSGHAPIRRMLDNGLCVALASDVSGGALLPMNQVMTACIRTSKAVRIESGWNIPFLTVAEAYYLGTSAAASYFGDNPGFAQGNRLHALVVNDAPFPKVGDLCVAERFERAIYLMTAENIQAVYGDGKRIK